MDWFQRNFTPDQLLAVPARSPDFNPIEHAWAQAKVNVRQDGSYQSENDLWLAISEAWIEMRENAQTFAQNLVNSLPNRLYEAFLADGGVTKY